MTVTPAPLLPEWQGVRTPIVGMVHLPPLPGSPHYASDLSAVHDALHRDAAALTNGGVQGLLVENLGDRPYCRGRVPPEVTANMAVLAETLVREYQVPLGVNVLRNDGLTALAVAQAVGGKFIRVNVLCGARLTDQGVVRGIADKLMRYRRILGADVKVLADVRVKHSAPLAERDLTEEVLELVDRGMADGLIVSGPATGRPVDRDELDVVRAAAGGVPVFVGSGATPDTAPEMANHCDGFIVGTALKRNGALHGPVDIARVRAFVGAIGQGAATR